MTRTRHLAALIVAAVFLISSCAASGQKLRSDDLAPRSFYMGFTPWPYDMSVPALVWGDRAIRAHGDIISQTFEEGVPWPEALAGKPYQHGMEKEIRDRVQRMEGSKRVVSISPLNTGRNGLAPYRGDQANLPLPKPWDKIRFNDARVKTAYLQYAQRIVEEMKPDYLVAGVEVNLLLRNRPEQWEDYLELHKATYQSLKIRYPKLPILVSVVFSPYFEGLADEDKPEIQRRELTRLLAYTDLLGFSIHPFMTSWLAEKLPDESFFGQMFALSGGKPCAITESSFPGREWHMKINGGDAAFRGTPTKQQAFVSQMLNAADRAHLAFVIWFAIRDYKALWERMGRLDSLLVWRDTGLFDSDGKARLGLDTWDGWLTRPKR